QIPPSGWCRSSSRAGIALEERGGMAAGRPDLGFTRLINAIKVTSGDAREELRTHLLELFTAVGADTEVVRSARRDLASALF
ncbi:tetratricopeptide repeat protein, partial [Actinotignum timonense]|nr:tetratricopeptide repeat protein [Actinotignum timonense]